MRLRTRILLVLLGVLCVAYFVLVRQAPAPGNCAFKLDMAKIRAAAASLPGSKAQSIRFDHVTTFRMPGAVVVTGESWAKTEMPVFAYQLVFPDHTIIVDTAMDAAQATKGNAEDFDPAAWARVEKAMAAASEIYVTHEHSDHLGGLAAALGNPAVIAAARLTRLQLANYKVGLAPVELPAAALRQLKTIDAGQLLAVAPGVVLIAAPGHTPGSQFVFVQLADGRELLFTGDTAWHRQNIDEVRGPPRLTSLMLKNDRNANVCQLQALHELAASDSKVSIVPGHDGVVMKKLVADGLLTSGLQ